MENQDKNKSKGLKGEVDKECQEIEAEEYSQSKSLSLASEKASTRGRAPRRQTHSVNYCEGVDDFELVEERPEWQND